MIKILILFRRGHDFTLVKEYLLESSHSFRTINEWNKLYADCVHASSANKFKNRIDN